MTNATLPSRGYAVHVWTARTKALACIFMLLSLGAWGGAPAGLTGPAPFTVSTELAHPVIQAGAPQTTYLKVGLRGRKAGDKPRTPVNLAIVIDRSGSMSGAKIAEARRAATLAVEALAPDDIVSVVTYHTVAEVLVPATRVGSSRAQILHAVSGINPAGSTALYAGVSLGAGELRRFADGQRINRIILLSDGLANVGPSSPGDLAALGIALGREGITVTTLGLGLGYNEDLMYQLAMASDGNHAFVEDAAQLATIFSHEFGDLFSVVATGVSLRVELASGIKPLRTLGRPAEITGGVITARFNQVYAEQEKFVMIEVMVPAGAAGRTLPAASVVVTHQGGVADGKASFRTVASAQEAASRVNQAVMVEAVALLANEQTKTAMLMRDQGKVHEARELLQQNEVWVGKAAKEYKSDKLRKLERVNRESAKDLDDDQVWNRSRKEMRDVDYEVSTQQSY